MVTAAGSAHVTPKKLQEQVLMAVDHDWLWYSNLKWTDERWHFDNTKYKGKQYNDSNFNIQFKCILLVSTSQRIFPAY